MSNRVGAALAVARAALPRPWLWWTVVRQAQRTVARGWWRRPPFLPVPSREYVGFRMLTQYGDANAVPTVDDVVHYLEWCRRFP